MIIGAKMFGLEHLWGRMVARTHFGNEPMTAFQFLALASNAGYSAMNFMYTKLSRHGHAE